MQLAFNENSAVCKNSLMPFLILEIKKKKIPLQSSPKTLLYFERTLCDDYVVAFWATVKSQKAVCRPLGRAVWQ